MVKTCFLLRCLYGIYTILIKTPVGFFFFFVEIQKMVIKLIGNANDLNSKTTLIKNKVLRANTTLF